MDSAVFQKAEEYAGKEKEYHVQSGKHKTGKEGKEEMKIMVSAEELKRAIAKMKPVIPNRAALKFITCVRIEAKQNMVKLIADGIDKIVSIDIFGVIMEEGCADFEYSDLKKIANIKDDVTITTSRNGAAEFRSPKKSYTIPSYDLENDIRHSVILGEHGSTEISADILANLKNLSVMTSKFEKYGIMTCLYFDLEEGNIVALDRHRIGIQKIKAKKAEPFMITNECVPILNSLIGKKPEGNIKVIIDKKYIEFAGEDFCYIQKRTEGNYYKYAKMFKDNYKNSFTVGNKEIAEVSKEYRRIIPATNMKPMIITMNEDSVCTGVHVAGLRTSDYIESACITNQTVKDFYIAVDPQYIIDACNFIGGDLIVYTDSQKNPMTIKNEDGDKICLILPVNFIGDGSPNGLVDYVRQQAG